MDREHTMHNYRFCLRELAKLRASPDKFVNAADDVIYYEGLVAKYALELLELGDDE